MLCAFAATWVTAQTIAKDGDAVERAFERSSEVNLYPMMFAVVEQRTAHAP